jgi:5'-3' exoribonuclease 2
VSVRSQYALTVIDVYLFYICVGNDFLPHLPSLDIRDGALDYLMDCYKDLLPAIGSYLTSPGGNVNLSAVDVLMARVSEVEDVVFRRRKEADDEQIRRRNQNPRPPFNRAGPGAAPGGHGPGPAPSGEKPSSSSGTVQITDNKMSNQLAAQRLKESFLGKRKLQDTDAGNEPLCEVRRGAEATNFLYR